MGLGCAALTGNPRFPTYPNPLSMEQNQAGLSSPATAIALLGKGGAVLMLVLLFMAVTSSTSAELIAVSSLLTFDVYKTYIHPDAPSAKLVTISHIGIVIYALVLAAFCCILNAVGLNLTWLLTVLAIIVGGASIPVGLVLLWKRMSTAAAVGAPWIGLVCGLLAWFVTTWKRSGSITVATSGDTTNAVAGNITSWGVGFVMSGVLTLAFPAKYTSLDPKHIERSNKIQGISAAEPAAATASAAGPDVVVSSSYQESKRSEQDVPASPSEADTEKASPPFKTEATHRPASAPEPEAFVPTGNDIVDFLETKQMAPMDPVAVRKGERIAVLANLAFALIAIILVPFTLFGTAYVYNKAFFTGWVVVSFIWVWTSMCICVVYPVVESTGALKDVSLGLWGDFRSLFRRS
jgi:urea-proton symporter